jgi:L-aspartate oxidase
MSQKHVIVVGSGIAGLIAAIELSREHAVTLVTKGALAESNTRWAQGGIAAAMASDDTIAAHIADTLAAGAGLCNAAAVEVLCSEGPARIRDLIRLGVAFDQRDGELARGLEAAHSHPRVLHAGGDATGYTIEMALVAAVRALDTQLRSGSIRILEHTFACDLVVRNGVVTGLDILTADNEPQQITAGAVVLASGGAGQLFRHTTNPRIATGDGVAMALRAGAQLADLEFYQFHPTALADESQGTFLISEAVRGEGAVLLDSNGRRFMQALHPAAELAPRDVVARGIARQMALQDGAPVLLDATGLTAQHGADFLATRFPSIDAACRVRGLDWSRRPIPVTPAAHYWMGGVRTDTFGRTSVPGLYAVGEAACTGVHGANRLASNSLLESLVFAWRCAHQLSHDEVSHWPALPSQLPAETLHIAPHATAKPADRTALQATMWSCVGIERGGHSLKEAALRFILMRPKGETVEQLETRNLLDLASVMVRAALSRKESRGAHFRSDFPETSPELAHSLIYQSSGCPISGTSDMGLQAAAQATR